MMDSHLTENITPNPKEETRLFYMNWRDKFVIPLLIGSLVTGIFTLFPIVSSTGNTTIRSFIITIYVLIGIVITVRFPYSIRIGVFLLSLYSLGLAELITHGVLGDSIFFFLGLIIFATMFLTPRSGIVAIFVDVVTFSIIGWLMLNGIVVPLFPDASLATVEEWISASVMILMFGTVIILAFQQIEVAFLNAQKQIDTTLSTLNDERNNLENIVAERTQQLRRVNNIGYAVTSILDPNDLLESAVTLIGENFNCYYTAIFLIDSSGHWAELKTATGDAGRVLRENKHHVDINGKSAIGIAIRTRQAHLSLDSGDDPIQFDNPLLPYTRSQIILPLAIGNRTIGALEMHSTKENAFSQQEVDVYQNMANQVTIAIENSRLFTETQQSLAEARATQEQYIQDAWLTLVSEQNLDYAVGDSELTGKQEINIPLALRDQIIGQIEMSSTVEWTPEQKNLIESIAAQAALALENARLVEESRSIAARERLVNDITSKVWASTTMDSILQTTVRELGRALEAAEVDIEVSMGKIYE